MMGNQTRMGQRSVQAKQNSLPSGFTSPETRVWSDAEVLNGKGETTGYTNVLSIRLKQNARYIVGLSYLIVPAIQTVNVASRPKLKITSSDLGFVGEEFLLDSGIGDPIATNNPNMNVVAGILPLLPRIDAGEGYDNALFEVDIGSTVAITGGWSGAIGLIYSDRPVGFDFWSGLMSGIPIRASGSSFVTGTGKASSLTNLSTDLKIPAYASLLTAIEPSVDVQDETTEEEVAGIMKLSSKAIVDFEPQLWVIGNGAIPSLGTPQIGAGVQKSRSYSTHFPLPRQAFDISVDFKLCQLLTNDVRLNCGIRYR
jgi:hypothetical protein